MIEELKNYIGIPIRLQLNVIDGGDCAWQGTIKEFKRDNRILVFEHCEEDRKKFKIKKSTVDLRTTRCWAFDELDETENLEEKLNAKSAVGKILCPHCNDPIYIVDVEKLKELKAEHALEKGKD